jgi:hypothetical protein
MAISANSFCAIMPPMMDSILDATGALIYIAATAFFANIEAIFKTVNRFDP